MEPEKLYYVDEDELIDEYCRRIKCSECHGSDFNGEPTGYGCINMEEWVDEHSLKVTFADND